VGIAAVVQRAGALTDKCPAVVVVGRVPTVGDELGQQVVGGSDGVLKHRRTWLDLVRLAV
jgi:hypothetical protein